MCEFMSANRVLTDKSDSYRNGRYREEHQCTHTKQSERKTNSVNKRISFTSFIIALMVCLGVLLPACIGTKHPDRPSPTPDAVDPVATQPSASPGLRNPLSNLPPSRLLSRRTSRFLSRQKNRLPRQPTLRVLMSRRNRPERPKVFAFI